MHLVLDLLTGEKLDLDAHSERCNRSGFYRASSELVEPLIAELTSLKDLVNEQRFPWAIQSIDNIILYTELRKERIMDESRFRESMMRSNMEDHTP